MLCLYLQAPFGVFRTFTAGSFRPTAGFITPSAAYGLLLNLAGIEMRHEAEKEMTLIREGLPRFRIALGALKLPLQHTIYQQLHNYPVGDSAKDHAPKTKGNKYNIAPVRRSFLSGLQAYVCVDAGESFETCVAEGLFGRIPRMYGLPFLGDNNFLIDRLETVQERQPAYWFVRLGPRDPEPLGEKVTRLTISVDRLEMSNTFSALFAPTQEVQTEIPDRAWVAVGYS